MTRRRVRTLAGLTALCGLAVAATWWSWRSPPAPSNVVLITLDTFRADRMGAYGYAGAQTPHLDALARAGARFTDAVSAAPITGPAHAALMTGLYPARLGVRDNATTPLPESVVTLAEAMADSGYDTGGFIGAFILDRPYGFAQGFQTFDGFTRVESGSEANAERRGELVVDAALRWLSGRTAGRPFFLWLHLYDPHAPYAAPAPYGAAFADRPYDGELAYTDAQVGRLLEALRARHVMDRTLVMAVADHGESLGAHGENDHGVFLYEPVMRIPWIVSGPGISAGRVIDDQVRSVDLAPTVLGAVGLPVPGSIDGEDLTPLLRGETRADAPAAYAESFYPRLHYGWSELRSLRADGWKAIDAPAPELYHVREDPGESNNLYEAQRPLADRMIAEAVRLEREFTGGAPIETTQPDPDTLERLRSLGYIGTTATVLPAGERGPDPKDRINEHREFTTLLSEAIDDLRAKEALQAAGKLRRVIALNDKSYDAHELLGEAYQTLGRLTEALGEYEYAALLNPVAPAPLLAAAEVQIALGNLAAARARAHQAEVLDPGSFDVSMVSGRLLEAEGRFAEAVSAYERAVTLNGANPRPRVLLVSLASRLERHDLAESHLRALLVMGYQPSRTHFALGRLAQLRGRIDEAAQHYREALRLEPGLTMAAEGLKMIGR